MKRECVIKRIINSPLKNPGLPWWIGGNESSCQCSSCGFDPWSRKIPPALVQLGLHATITGATATDAHVPDSPCPATREARDEKPAHCDKKEFSLAATRESPCSSEDPAQSKMRRSIKGSRTVSLSPPKFQEHCERKD